MSDLLLPDDKFTFEWQYWQGQNAEQKISLAKLFKAYKRENKKNIILSKCNKLTPPLSAYVFIPVLMFWLAPPVRIYPPQL